jgi:hypothetical protein
MISCALNLGWAGAFWTLAGGVCLACEIYHKLSFRATIEPLENAGRGVAIPRRAGIHKTEAGSCQAITLKL